MLTHAPFCFSSCGCHQERVHASSDGVTQWHLVVGGGFGTRQWVASKRLVPACAVLDVATRWRALFSAFVASCAGPPWTWVATHACRPLRTAIKINRHASSCTHPLANTRVCLCVARESGCSVRVLLERKCTTQTSTLTMWLSGKNQPRRSRGRGAHPWASPETTHVNARARNNSRTTGAGNVHQRGVCARAANTVCTLLQTTKSEIGAIQDGRSKLHNAWSLGRGPGCTADAPQATRGQHCPVTQKPRG